MLREYVTIHRASSAGASTRLGSNNLLMTCSHVGHDCQVGDNVVIASSTALAGHVHIEDRVFVSGGVMIHQFTQVGRYAMIGGNSKITQDVLPFFITDGVPGVVRGLNLVGLRRAGFESEDVKALKGAFRVLFRESLSLAEALERLRASDNAHVGHLAEFIGRSRRGFHRA
jgi:UDP-N-acetylglucosamine acyltransferase